MQRTVVVLMKMKMLAFVIQNAEKITYQLALCAGEVAAFFAVMLLKTLDCIAIGGGFQSPVVDQNMAVVWELYHILLGQRVLAAMDLVSLVMEAVQELILKTCCRMNLAVSEPWHNKTVVAFR